jgi:hypothetical protein
VTFQIRSAKSPATTATASPCAPSFSGLAIVTKLYAATMQTRVSTGHFRRTHGQSSRVLKLGIASDAYAPTM